jgi:hypothetical protein
LTKWLACIFGSMPSRCKHPVGFRDQRLADVEARGSALALEQADAAALLREQRRRRRACRSAANHDHVVLGHRQPCVPLKCCQIAEQKIRIGDQESGTGSRSLS